MIYVLAAYSITIGTLALYGVLMQHRSRIHVMDQSARSRPTHPQKTDPQPTAARPFGFSFNLGAALLSPFWMWQHGMRVAGAGLLLICLALVPLYEREWWIPSLFVAMVPLAAGTALGLVGDRIARNHRASESPVEVAASQLPWALVGVGLFTVVLPWVWYFRFAPAA